MWNEPNCVVVVRTFFGVALLETGIKTHLFQLYSHCWVFQICWHIKCSTFTASSFRIWTSSAGIPSSPLALFVVMPTWFYTLGFLAPGDLWLSGSLSPFLYSSSVCSCHLFLIPSASLRGILFLPFTVPMITWNVPLLALIFLKTSLVFLIVLLSSIFLHCSLNKAFLSRLSILWILHSDGYIFPFVLCALLLFFFHLFVRPSQKAIFHCCISASWGWFFSLPPIQTSIHSSSGTLSDPAPWIFLSFLLYNHKSRNGLVVFPAFFKSEFHNKELMIWATVSFQSWFC